MKDHTLFGCSKVIWIYPLPHSGGKQRFVGIPNKKVIILVVVTVCVTGRINLVLQP